MLLDIEKILSQENNGHYKKATLKVLEDEVKEIKEEMDSGMSPSKFERFNKYLYALNTSIKIIKDYQPTSIQECDDDTLNELSNNLNWLISQVGFYASHDHQAEKAIIIFEGFVAVHQDNTSIRESLAMTYLFAGEYDKSISTYRENILISDPYNYKAKSNLGYALCKKGKSKEGEALLRDAEKNGDEMVKTLSNAYLDDCGFASKVTNTNDLP